MIKNNKCLLNFVFVICLLFQFNLKAQTFEPDFKDGMIWFKFNNNIHLNFIIGDGNVIDIKNIPFLSGLINTYKITSLKRPFNINNDENLLLVFQLEFDEYSKINELVSDLNKNKDIEYVEKC